MRASAAFGLLISLLTLAPVLARAASDDLTAASRSELDRTVPAGARASIVIVAEESEHQGLIALLEELLQREAIASEFSRASRFDPEALFLETADDARVLVFVVVEARSVRLYFRGPGGQRFLLRKLELPSGLDAVGKELIGHVVESATLALLRSTEGLSRAQASAELTRDRANADAPARRTETSAVIPNSPGRALDPAPLDSPNATPPSPALELDLGVRYSALWSGSEFGLSHGPGAELGLAYRANHRWLLRVRLLGERHFSQTLASTELEASVRSTPLRAGIDLGVTASARHHLFMAAAAGADLVHTIPVSSFMDDIALRSATTRAVPMLRFELRYELVLGAVALAAAGFADASLVETRYELAESETRRTLGTPLPLRPGASLAVAFSPGAGLVR